MSEKCTDFKVTCGIHHMDNWPWHTVRLQMWRSCLVYNGYHMLICTKIWARHSVNARVIKCLFRWWSEQCVVVRFRWSCANEHLYLRSSKCPNTTLRVTAVNFITCLLRLFISFTMHNIIHLHCLQLMPIKMDLLRLIISKLQALRRKKL